MINDNDKSDDNISLGNDDIAPNEKKNNKNSTMIIIVKCRRMLEASKIAKNKCFHIMPYIHSSVKGFSRTYQWRP